VDPATEGLMIEAVGLCRADPHGFHLDWESSTGRLRGRMFNQIADDVLGEAGRRHVGLVGRESRVNAPRGVRTCTPTPVRAHRSVPLLSHVSSLAVGRRPHQDASTGSRSVQMKAFPHGVGLQPGAAAPGAEQHALVNAAGDEDAAPWEKRAS
jgi:hypothetical protein